MIPLELGIRQLRDKLFPMDPTPPPYNSTSPVRSVLPPVVFGNSQSRIVDLPLEATFRFISDWKEPLS